MSNELVPFNSESHNVGMHIPLHNHAVGERSQKTVNARDLYTFLQVKSRFSDWMTRRISQYGFSEDIDFITYSNLSTDGKFTQIDYFLTLNMAKELAMVERTKKGKEARTYFLECERIAQGQQLPHVVNPASRAMIDMIVRQDQLEQEVIALKERERQREYALIAQQAEIIKSLQQSRMADEKATLALNDTYRMTIREFVTIGNLLHQFPESSWRSASTFLGKYCAERNLECPLKPVSGKKWSDEKSYPMSALLAWQRHETHKWNQISIDGIQEDGVWYTDK